MAQVQLRLHFRQILKSMQMMVWQLLSWHLKKKKDLAEHFQDAQTQTLSRNYPVTDILRLHWLGPKDWR